ncbi:hypothetical protein DF947_00055 [Pedobacter paludis]|uniref:Uncharacterized protein n=1 Tax=Pedobacter paludis TaxID=2203212 RepID=A0A317F1N7_9SPHI|nr:hypothetical protein DF947_00055 [Pedobacter paludis]
MMMKIFLLFVSCIFHPLCEVIAAEGCRIGSVVYTGKITNIPGPFGLGNRPQFDSDPATALGLYGGSCPVGGAFQYASITGLTLENCGFTTNYNDNTIGTVVNYDIVQCNFDYMIPLLAFPLIGLALFHMEKKQVKVIT